MERKEKRNVRENKNEGLKMEQKKIERERRKKNLVIKGVNVEKTNIGRRIEYLIEEKN